MTSGAQDIVLVHRYYSPDRPPYAEMLRRIAEALAADGNTVSVIASQPSYGDEEQAKAPSVERCNGVDVRRVSLFREKKSQTTSRVLNLGLFAVQAFALVVRRRPDVVMAATTPPVIMGWAMSLAASAVGADFVYHCQDIHPEVLRPHGHLPWWARVLRWVDVGTGTRATRIVVLSASMRETWAARGIDTAKVEIINNFDCSDVVEPEHSDREPPGSRVVFAGNLGRFQNLDLLVEAVGRVPSLELDLVGDGVASAELQRLVAEKEIRNVRFSGRVSAKEAKQAVANADLAVVSLQPGLHRFVFPSKTFTYLAAGTPILTLLEPQSDLARFIRAEQLGVVPDSTRIDDVVESLSAFAGIDSAERSALRERVARAGEQHAASARLEHWCRFFAGLSRSG